MSDLAYASQRVETLEERNAELQDALANLVAAFVNPRDGGQFEDGEVPALDVARRLLVGR